MEQAQRALAQIFAQLASIPSLEELREGERLLLNEDIKDALWQWINSYLPGHLTPEDKRKAREEHDEFFHSLGELDDVRSPLLKKFHAYTREIVWGLLDGKQVTEPSIALPERKLR